MSDNSPKKDLGLLRELMARGKNYRKDFPTDVFGDEIVLVLRPVPDEEYNPLMGQMMELAGLTEAEAVEELEDALEDVDGDASQLDPGMFSDEYMEIMKQLCLHGIDAEAMGGSADDLAEIIKGAVGGYVLEWAYEILDLTGNIRDAQDFR